MKRLVQFSAILILAGSGITSSRLSASSFEGDGPRFDLYGYLTNCITMTFRGNDGNTSGVDPGYVLYLRMKGDWYPHESLTFHVEASYTGSLGNQNAWAIYDYYGLLPFNPTDYPTFDYVQSFDFDHIWARWTGSLFDLTYGKTPIAWGTGYIFNPTSRAAGSAFMDFVHEETPGTFAIVPVISPAWWMSIEGYLAFQEKTHSKLIRLIEGSWEDLPFGVRAKLLAGPADISAGLVREVADYEGDGTPDDDWYATADAVMTLGPFGMYFETAWLLPVGDDGSGLDGWNSLDGVLGLEWLLPGIPVTLRMEYYHQGQGFADKGAYDFTDIFTGRRNLLARDYLYGHLELTFLNYGRLGIGSLMNINDGSFLIAPQIAWDVLSDFTVELGAYVFIGEGDDEFGGLVLTSAGLVDLMEPNMFFRFKMSY